MEVEDAIRAQGALDLTHHYSRNVRCYRLQPTGYSGILGRRTGSFSLCQCALSDPATVEGYR